MIAIIKTLIGLFRRDEPVGRITKPSIKFPKGTEIVCSNCDKSIAVSNKDVYSGGRMSSLDWSEVEPLSSMQCPDCKTSYYRRTSNGLDQLHTSQGWVG